MTEIYSGEQIRKVSDVSNLTGAQLGKLQINVGRIVRAVGIK